MKNPTTSKLGRRNFLIAAGARGAATAAAIAGRELTPDGPQAVARGDQRRRKSHQETAPVATEESAGKIEVKRSVCTHCSVGCAIDAVVQNGVWVRQEPVFDSPLNLGAHCAKGASVREHGMTEHSHRLKYPMKLVNGKYQR